MGQALVWPERPWPLPWLQGKLKRKVDIMARRTNKPVSDPFVSNYFLFFFFLIFFPLAQSLQPMLRISTSQTMKIILSRIRRTEADIMKQNEQKETKERMMKSGNMTIW